MPRVSKPMKLITLRISEEEKARLEHLAERGNVTLSRALREGAALFLSDAHGKVHAARGGRTTFHGVRRNQEGIPLTSPSKPTKRERALLVSLTRALHDSALGAIRDAWLAEGDARIVLGALSQWLNLIGELYASNAGYIGWSWFVKDYCPGYSTPAARDELSRLAHAGLVTGYEDDLTAILEALDEGMERFLRDVEQQDRVRRAVLPVWQVMEPTLS
jgi:hypothetical protein